MSRVPMLSEGTISPMQVARMSPRQREAWSAKVQEQMRADASANWTEADDRRVAEAKRSGRVAQLERLIADMSRVGMSRKTGKMRPTFQRQIDEMRAELETLSEPAAGGVVGS